MCKYNPSNVRPVRIRGIIDMGRSQTKKVKDHRKNFCVISKLPDNDNTFGHRN